MFSSTTMLSSTIMPSDRIIANSEMRFTVKPVNRSSINVRHRINGSTKLMISPERRPRNGSSVRITALIATARSRSRWLTVSLAFTPSSRVVTTCTSAGMNCWRRVSTTASTSSAVVTALVPGFLATEIVTAGISEADCPILGSPGPKPRRTKASRCCAGPSCTVATSST